MTIKVAWTDYPILKLGDVSGKDAPLRLVEVLSYDKDKYCEIRVHGVRELVKRGYLYKVARRLYTHKGNGKFRWKRNIRDDQMISDRQLKKLPVTKYGE